MRKKHLSILFVCHKNDVVEGGNKTTLINLNNSNCKAFLTHVLYLISNFVDDLQIFSLFFRLNSITISQTTTTKKYVNSFVIENCLFGVMSVWLLLLFSGFVGVSIIKATLDF